MIGYSKIRFVSLLLVVGVSLVSTAEAQVNMASAVPADSNKTVAFVNGHIWNGEQFVDRPLIIRGGRFTGQGVEVDTTINLRSGYIVPPFGDAHTHMLGSGGISIGLADSVFTQNGIFYAADLTNPHSEIAAVREGLGKDPMSLREWFKKPTTLDVAYALGGITSTGSWPAPVFEPEDSPDSTWSAEGDAFWFMDTVEEVREKWPEYIAQEPDIVKVYLTYVSFGLVQTGRCYGLCPEVLEAVVKRAHNAGLRVWAHVNTASDVHIALEGGVDVLAHLPLGNDGISTVESWPYRLSEEQIQRIAEQDVAVVPTALLLVEDLETFRKDTLQQEIALQRQQVRSLHEAGVPIALSGHGSASLREAMYFHAYNFFDNQTLLNLWSKTTPQVIFPKRKIGVLKPGYEASFLSLDCNPIENFECVKDIRWRVKEGHILAESEPQ